MATAPFHKILLPVDGSSYSMDAARQAIALAQVCGAEVLLMHSRQKIPDFIGMPYYQRMLDHALEVTEKLLAPFRELLESAAVPFDELVLEGEPARNVVTAAEVEQCDLVVMGSRGLSDLEGLFLGSTSHRVLTTAPCPVLTVR